jgi:uncharacterized membrane protein YgcG
MKRVVVFLAFALALVAAPLQALAATYIQDNANMFTQGAKTQASNAIDDLVRRTNKEILVVTVPSLNGQDPNAAADNVFRQNRVNGVLFFASRDDRRLEIVVGQDTKQALPDSRAAQIRQTMLNDFRANNQQGFDKGLIDGVNEVRSTLLGAGAGSSGSAVPVRQSGPNWLLIGMLIVLVLLVVWVIAGVINARRQQPNFSQQQPGYGQPGYGQPGYGGGPGFGGGGGFFAGLMGGLGGALLGNALFDAFRPRDHFSDGGQSTGGESGWQGDDAGQVGDTSGGSWNDPGGGGDWSGGGDVGGGDTGAGGDW